LQRHNRLDESSRQRMPQSESNPLSITNGPLPLRTNWLHCSWNTTEAGNAWFKKQQGETAMTVCDVAIIGAGPYGLSIAAHLKALGVDFRIFGSPMAFWLKHMPNGMHLKSEGFASSLYDPNSRFTLEAYCRERGLPYAHIGSPVPLETFSSYGLEFQRRFVPELEDEWVTSVQRSAEGFQLTLGGGEVFTSRRVVVAVGLSYYEYLPPELAALPKDFVTHSSRYGTLQHFQGREVAVVGAGASALDLAALLHQAGAFVQVIARVPRIRFHDPPENLNPSWLDRLRTPITGIGPGWKLFLCANLPLVFRQMPEKFRLEKVRRILGPAPCWFTKEQVVGKVGFHLGVTITEATVQNGRVKLQLTDTAGTKKALTTDHVIAATGYRPSVQRLAFLDSEILSGIRCVEQTPVLSSNFESTVRKLYFVGVTAANTFGPLLRFAYGAKFAAPRLSRHLARTVSGNFVGRESSTNTQPAAQHEAAQPVAG
jgi:thioredoxin reductase